MSSTEVMGVTFHASTVVFHRIWAVTPGQVSLLLLELRTVWSTPGQVSSVPEESGASQSPLHLGFSAIG